MVLSGPLKANETKFTGLPRHNIFDGDFEWLKTGVLACMSSDDILASLGVVSFDESHAGEFVSILV